MSKVIHDLFGFAKLRSVIGAENSRHHLNQSETKLKPVMIWTPEFSRVSRRLPFFTLSSNSLMMISTSVPICCCDYFSFGFGFSKTQL